MRVFSVHVYSAIQLGTPLVHAFDIKWINFVIELRFNLYWYSIFVLNKRICVVAIRKNGQKLKMDEKLQGWHPCREFDVSEMDD